MNQYIHIGAEVAAIAALTIRFQKQLGKLEQRIELLEKKIGQAKIVPAEKCRGPSVSIFEPEPKQSPAAQPPDFFMSFFPLFSKETPSAVSIHELEDEDDDENARDGGDDENARDDEPSRPEDVKAMFLKHLGFLADPDSLPSPTSVD